MKKKTGERSAVAEWNNRYAETKKKTVYAVKWHFGPFSSGRRAMPQDTPETYLFVFFSALASGPHEKRLINSAIIISKQCDSTTVITCCCCCCCCRYYYNRRGNIIIVTTARSSSA